MTLIAASGDDPVGFVNYLVGLGLSDRTIRIYGHAIDRWLIHCATEGVDPLTASNIDMRAYSDTLPDTHSSRRQHAVALNHWFTCNDREDSPTGAIRKPKRRRMRWNGIEQDQAAAIVQTSRGVYPEGTACLIGLCMGLRREEIAAFDWTQVSPGLDWYTVYGKGNIVEDVPLHETVRDEINGRQSAYRYLFPGKRTAYVNPATVSVWVGQIGRAAGLPDRVNKAGELVPGLTPHKLRHTFITDIHDRYGDLRVAQEMARHVSPETTAGYTRVTRDRMVDASRNLSYAPVRAVVNG